MKFDLEFLTILIFEGAFPTAIKKQFGSLGTLDFS